MAHKLMEEPDTRTLETYYQEAKSPMSPMDKAWNIIQNPSEVPPVESKTRTLSPKVQLATWNPFKSENDPLTTIQGQPKPWEDEESTI